MLRWTRVCTWRCGWKEAGRDGSEEGWDLQGAEEIEHR